MGTVMTEEQRQKKREQDRLYYEKNKEKVKQRSREWNEKNKERKVEASIRWAKENPDKVRAINQRFVSEHKDKKAKYNKEWRTKNYVQQYMLQNARNRAKKYGIPFDLSSEDITVPELCPVLGTPIAKSNGKLNDNSPSLDRLVPALGYVKGNVRVISWRANRIKSDASVEELRKLVEYLESTV